MKSAFLLALSTLIGTIVGAGIFSLPYVVQQSGLVPGVFYFVILGGVVMLLHLLLGEVCLRTTEKHRLVGYANIYLGQWGKSIATLVLLFVLLGALLAYLILAGNFLSIVFLPLISLSSVQFSFLFWAVLSLAVVCGIQLIARLELFINILFFSIIGAILFFAFPHIQIQNFSLLNTSGMFVPFGVLFFALGGWDAIPEIADFLKNKKDKASLDNVIVWASAITLLLYFLFSLVVIGVSGSATSADSFTGLKQFVGAPVIIFGALAGILAISGSFMVLGNYLKNSLYRDFKIPKPFATAIAMGVPLLLFAAGFREFIHVIGLVGALMGAVEGILIILMFQKAKKMGDRIPEYSISPPKVLLFLVAVVLLLGAAVELFL